MNKEMTEEEKKEKVNFRESKSCSCCKHIELTYHHCSACYENDEYTCKKHGFEFDNSNKDYYVCDDYE